MDRVCYQSFPDRTAAKAYIFQTQFARRNLTPEGAAYLRGQHYLAEKRGRGGDRRGQGPTPRSEGLETARRLARLYRVGHATIHRDAQFALAVDAITRHCGEAARTLILSRQTRLSRRQVLALAKRPPGEQDRFFREWRERGGRPPSRRRPAGPACVRLPREPEAFVEAVLRSFSLEDARALAQALARAVEAGPRPQAKSD